jgi:uncharacterized membrane protein YidH (DUF202 family)
MKKIFLILVLILIAMAGAVRATPFIQVFQNPDGTAQTNSFTLSAYPAANVWTVVGTNLVYGNYAITFTPNSSGYISNAIAPNTYQLLFSNLNSGFYLTIPNTTNVVSLSACVTSVPTTGNILTGYGLVTNWLSFAPATNSSSGIIAALGYMPPTNNYSSLTNALTFAPATNNPATNIIVYVSGLTVTTNGSGAITNIVLTYGTNTLNYQHQ